MIRPSNPNAPASRAAGPGATEPAEPGSLSVEAALGASTLMSFAAGRDRAMERLFGRKLRRSRSRDELLRLIILTFADGRTQRMLHYQRMCTHLATAPVIRAELTTMAMCGVVLLERDPTHQQALLVVPTRKLVDFYNTEISQLYQAMMDFLRERIRQEGPSSPFLQSLLQGLHQAAENGGAC